MELGFFFHGRIFLDHIFFGDGKKENGCYDGSDKYHACRSSSKSESTIFRRLREVISKGGPERTRHDIDDPKREYGIESDFPSEREESDNRDDYDPCVEVPETQTFCHEISCCSTERKGEKDSEPIKKLSSFGKYGMDGKGLFLGIPQSKDSRKQDTEYDSAYFQRNPHTVGEIIRYERSENADEDYRSPVGNRHVFL